MDEVGCIVIGAGVIGLAIARELAIQGLEVVVLETEKLIGSGVSSRNSEVIHGGIYYTPGSLKARFCREGRDLLYEYCTSHQVAFQRCEKLIVASTASQATELLRIQANALTNGVSDIVLIDSEEARRLEPRVHCVAALRSPSTGIVDSHGLMLALQGEMEDRGGQLVLSCPVTRISPQTSGLIEVEVADSTRICAPLVVNAAGLSAPKLAAAAGTPADLCPKPVYAKGSYFSLRGKAPFTRLVYPVPEVGGLGIHFTLDLGGQGRFGPDVEWIDELNFDVDPTGARSFASSIGTWWQGIQSDWLAPAYAGVRPKISVEGKIYSDFHIAGSAAHGIQGLVNLCGIESPGLTASLSIAQHVAALSRPDI